MAENKWVSLGLFHPETSGAKCPPTYNWFSGPTNVRIYILPEDSDTLTSLTGWQCDGIFFLNPTSTFLGLAFNEFQGHVFVANEFGSILGSSL